MSKKLFAYSLLACVVAWLLFSYVPELRQFLPEVAFPSAWLRGLAWLGALAAALFVAIQVWIVGSTFRSLRNRQNAPDSPEPIPGLHINLFGEIVWTALPILMTVGLILAGVAIWTAR
ncbi:MAG: hypothetical protein WDZ49_04180 [Litorilinea sp.]